jgi:hypothetical protein
MKKTIKKQVSIKIKIDLIIGVALILLSPLIAYFAAPIGCVLFPPVIDPNAWYIFPPCSGVNFFSFWVVLLAALITGTTITVYAIRSFSANKK